MTNQPSGSFFGLGIAPRLLEALERNKYTVPTPIQERAIPAAIEGKDMIGIAQTGTGKTLAFGIPMLQRLSQTKGQGLVILPTRELALQVEETLQKIGRSFGLRTAVLIGGASMGKQRDMIERKPHVVVATPGRLIDHIQQHTISLRDVRVLVLDEADRMLDMGFAPQIAKILAVVPKERQTLLFSATMPSEIVKIAGQHMKLPVRVEVARAGTAAEKVTQELIFVQKNDKTRLLDKLLAEQPGSVLVFSRTKHGAKKIAKSVKAMGVSSAEIHSNRSLAQRRDALDGFKSGKYRVLIATDIAARGIDVTGIELVINFDLPDNPEDYVHRIGRTGRAGRAGKAISFATPDQKVDVRAIERLIRRTVPVRNLPELPPARAHDLKPDYQSRPRVAYGRPHHSGGSSYGRTGHSAKSGRSGSDGRSHTGGRPSSGGGRPGGSPARSTTPGRAPHSGGSWSPSAGGGRPAHHRRKGGSGGYRGARPSRPAR